MSTNPTIENPDDILPALRALKEQLFSREATAEIKKCSEETRKAFVAERMRLTETILDLETAQLSEIRQDLEEQGEALNEGITELTTSLKKLEKAAQWAQSLSSVLSVVSKIVPAL
jgi:hypothetical protein